MRISVQDQTAKQQMLQEKNPPLAPVSFPLCPPKARSPTKPNAPADSCVFQSQSSLCCSYFQPLPLPPATETQSHQNILFTSSFQAFPSSKTPHRLQELILLTKPTALDFWAQSRAQHQRSGLRRSPAKRGQHRSAEVAHGFVLITTAPGSAQLSSQGIFSLSHTETFPFNL